MKKLLLVIIFLLIGSANFIHSQSPMVEAKYDRFTELTTITLSEERVMEFISTSYLRPRLIATITFKGKVPTDSTPSVGLILVSINESWKYLKNHELYALVNDKPMTMPETEHQGQTWADGDVIESIIFVLDWDRFCKLCEAQKVEFKLGTKEFKIAAVERGALKMVRKKYEEMLKDGREK